MDYSKIKKAITHNNYRLRDFIIEKIGMTEGGFYHAIKNHTLKIRDLEKISEALNLPMTYWFKEEEEAHIINETQLSYEKLDLRRQMTKFMEEEVINGKDETIEEKNKSIQDRDTTIHHLQELIKIQKEENERLRDELRRDEAV